jgi:hypothetical protein
MGPARPPRPWTIFLLGAAIASPLAWSTVVFVYIGMNAFGRTLSFERALLAGLPDWYFWAFAAPVVFWLGFRYRFERSSWMRAACVHAVAGTLVALVALAFVTLLNRALDVPSPTFAGTLLDAFLRMVLRYFHFDLMIYGLIVAAAHAVRYYSSFRAQELAAVELGAELDRAKLAALHMQLQPHFFFNTLHTIATLVREGRGEAATDTIARFGDLFRRTTRAGYDGGEVTLSEELSFVEEYLAIEQLRFSDRLAVQIDIEPRIRRALVPFMLLQPLAENAVRHGIARDESAQLITLRAWRDGEVVRIEIRNDGPAFAGVETAGGRQGVGLANVRARLERLYGSTGRLTLAPGDGYRGTVATVVLPWRDSATSAPAAAMPASITPYAMAGE